MDALKMLHNKGEHLRPSLALKQNHANTVNDINTDYSELFSIPHTSEWREPRPEKALALPDLPWLRDTLMSHGTTPLWLVHLSGVSSWI